MDQLVTVTSPQVKVVVASVNVQVTIKLVPLKYEPTEEESVTPKAVVSIFIGLVEARVQVLPAPS